MTETRTCARQAEEEHNHQRDQAPEADVFRHRVSCPRDSAAGAKLRAAIRTKPCIIRIRQTAIRTSHSNLFGELNQDRLNLL